MNGVVFNAGRLCHRLRLAVIVPQLTQSLQSGTGAVGVFAGRESLDDEAVGFRRVDEQPLPLRALAAQQRNLRLRLATRFAATLRLRQRLHHPLAVISLVMPVCLVQMAIGRMAGTTAHGEQGQKNDDQGTHGFLRNAPVSTATEKPADSPSDAPKE